MLKREYNNLFTKCNLERMEMCSGCFENFCFTSNFPISSVPTNIRNCYILRLSLHKMSTMIGWFLVTCLWSNLNVSRPGYHCAVVTRTLSLFLFAIWLFKGQSKYITKHLMYGRLGKHQDSQENKTNCFPRDHTLNVYCFRFYSKAVTFSYFLIDNALLYHFLANWLAHNKKMTEKSVFRETWGPEMTSQSFVKFDTFGTSKHGEGKSLWKNFLLYLSVHWGDLIEQIKKSIIHTLNCLDRRCFTKC